MNPVKSVWDMSLETFREVTRTRGTPGCGAVAAVTADLGLALVLKGLGLSQAKAEKKGDETAPHQALIERGEALLEALVEHAQEDVEAFEAYMAASKQAEEDTNRDLQAAVSRINRVPLAIAEVCNDALALSIKALPLTVDYLQSDTRAGGRLLHGGLSAVLLSVDANLSSIEDREEQIRLAKSRRGFQQEADRQLANLEARE